MVKQLVTHTAGASYWFWNHDIVRWEAVTGTPNVLSGENVIFTAPLVADPRTRFEYGINIDWLGKVIEGASGSTLDVVIAENITGPLGMAETAFLMSPDQRAKSVPVHLKGEDGSWAASDIDLRQDPDYWAGGHGLHSTPRDFLRFQRTLLGDGTSPDGVKALEKDTVDAAFTNQIGELDFPRRSRVPIRRRRWRSTWAPATSGATACCSTPRTCRARAAPGAAPGLGCSTPTSGSTAPRA
jgi:CubicO group peptidase (beta-lactamase class C family)